MADNLFEEFCGPKPENLEYIKIENDPNYVFVNDDLNTCYEKILNVVKTEKKGEQQYQDRSEIEEKVKKLIE